MALTVTLSSLREQARQRADMVNSRFILDDEWNTYINSAYTELRDLLITQGADWFVESQVLNLTGAQDYIEIPDNVYKLVGIDYSLGGEQYPMQKFIFADRFKYKWNSNVLRYRIVGGRIEFRPQPAAQAITLWYVPPTTLLQSDSDEVDGVNGWEDYIIVDAAIKALLKEESDVTALMAEKQGLTERISMLGASRDQQFPERVTDVTGMNYPDAYWLGDV